MILDAHLSARETKITDAKIALLAVDENVVTFEVSMDHRRLTRVKVREAFKDIAAPTFYHFPANHFDLKGKTDNFKNNKILQHEEH